MAKLALVHDFGKATTWFQQYIDDDRPDPKPTKRYHAPLGAFAAYHVLYETGYSSQTCFAGFVTVAKHHEPGERRYSLALNIADLFKPLFADRVIFRLLNRNQLTTDDFKTDLNLCLLTERGREMFSKAFEEMLEETVEHPRLNRKVSYKHFLRVEAYKLKKHILTDEDYVPFKRWW